MPCDLIRNELSIYETHEFEPEGTPWVNIWLKATFAYYPEAKTCFIHDASSGYDVTHGHATVVETTQDFNYNQGGGIFGTGKKYAYIERNVTLDNGLWKGKHTFTFRIEVNSDGNPKRDASYT